jgi:copper resistance protein C
MLDPAIKSVRLLGCALVLASMSVGGALAHTMLRSTSIADGARLEVAPSTFTLRFDHRAWLGAVQLATQTGERIPLDFVPSRAMSDTFVVPLPRLEPDRYRLSWRVIAEDGHVMAGTVAFAVTGPVSRPAASKRN